MKFLIPSEQVCMVVFVQLACLFVLENDVTACKAVSFISVQSIVKHRLYEDCNCDDRIMIVVYQGLGRDKPPSEPT